MGEQPLRRGADDRSQPTGPEEPVSSANWIQTMRTTQGIHVSLSQMADQKSSILMGATLVIFTITIGQATRGGGPPLALLVLGFFAFVTAVLVMMATMPAIGRVPLRPDQPPNLLFFGSFTQLSEDEYVRRLMAETRTEEGLRRLILHDLYQNGTVLQAKKYRLLGYAYRSFLLGLTLSLLTFVAGYFVPALAAVQPLSHPFAL